MPEKDVTSLLRKRFGILSAGLTALMAAAGLLEPTNIGGESIAFYLSIARHLRPEIIILFAISLLILFGPDLSDRVSVISKYLRSRRTIMIVAGLIALCLVSSGVVYYMKTYARARYSYFAKGGVHVHFQIGRLEQAFQLEREYQYENAIQKYNSLKERYPNSKYNHLIKQRLSLNQGLLDYGNRMYTVARKEEERHGISRIVVDLYLESLRVNPRHMESREQLTRIQNYLANEEKRMSPFVDSCTTAGQRSLEVHLLPDALGIAFLVDLPRREGSVTTQARNLCAMISRFPDNVAFFDMVKRSWNIDRLENTLTFSKSILDGKNMTDIFGSDNEEDRNATEISLPNLELSLPYDQNTIRYPPLPPELLPQVPQNSKP